MKNMTWISGSFSALFKDGDSAKAVSGTLYSDSKFTDSFEPKSRFIDILHIGVGKSSYDFEQSVKELKELVESYGGTLEGFAVVEMDNGAMFHVGITDENEVVKIDVEDIISLRTDDLIKVRDLVRSLS